MLKFISCLAFTMALHAYVEAAPIVNMNPLENQETEMAPATDEEVIPNDLEDVQWRRQWTCWSRNRRGQTFQGRGPSREHARRSAMSRCNSVSNACALRGCR